METRVKDPKALIQQAFSMHRSGNIVNAIEIYRKLVKQFPGHAHLLFLLGSAEIQLGNGLEGVKILAHSLEISPNNPDAHYNRGNALRGLNRLDEALQSFNRSIELRPDYAYAHWNKSLLLLLNGDFENGWKLYEWRWKSVARREVQRNFHQPLWLGQEFIADKSILIYAEQGLGDVIQFCRYLSMIENLGAKIILEIPRSLMSLISTLKCGFSMVEKGHQIPPFDFQCPIMSLPYALKTTVKTIPSDIPYLFADSQKRSVWSKKLGTKSMLRVGLVWSGSATHYNDRNRSLELNLLQSLFDLPVEFHSLQKEYGEKDELLLNQTTLLRNHQVEMVDFSDTAALVSEMDLVISVDTSVAHLAGALGKTVWILLPFAPDYRWMLDRSDSPWYPTATLFRQFAVGDWGGVINEIRNKLEELLKSTSAFKLSAR